MRDDPKIQRDQYQGFFAEFYDVFHEGCNDALLFPDLLKNYGTRVLELGCGTGRLAIPLSKAGFKVIGLDNAPGMLSLLYAKEYPKDNLRVVTGDARNFDLGECFDVILIGCNFINHFLDAADIIKMLQCSKKHLAEHGVVIIDGTVPYVSIIKNENGLEIVEDYPTKYGTIIHDHFYARFDLLSQIEVDDIQIDEMDGERLVRSATAHETLTWYFPREIRSLVREAGLRVVKETGLLADSACETPISLENNDMTFYCAKA
jgi:SAM-dependent methyltransferase